MKIETITPQIAALYLGQQCDVEWLTAFKPFVKGDKYAAVIDYSRLSLFENNDISITPHLRRLESLTEAEARKLYEIVNGEKWASEKSCIYNWWEQDFGYEVGVYKVNIGSPAVWLKLLSWGFDLFGLIDSGLAKEVGK